MSINLVFCVTCIFWKQIVTTWKLQKVVCFFSLKIEVCPRSCWYVIMCNSNYISLELDWICIYINKSEKLWDKSEKIWPYCNWKHHTAYCFYATVENLCHSWLFTTNLSYYPFTFNVPLCVDSFYVQLPDFEIKWSEGCPE